MKKSIFSIFVLALLFACAEEKRNREADKGNKEEEKEKAIAPIEEHKQRAYYPIPSPEQMFGFINDIGLEYSGDLVNTTESIGNYTNPTEKALNFGVYTADLAYAAAYQDIESTIQLYKAVKRLGAELNIAEMMSDEMLQQVQLNLENPDSLASIASNSYYQAVEYLEGNQQEGKLALMSLGGWIESLHITMNTVEEFDQSSPAVSRIAAQKITFGNLYTYLKKNEDEMGVAEEIEAIQAIRGVFASMEEGRSAKATKGSNGKLVFGKGKKIMMSENQFTELKTAIEAYRSRMIGEK